VTAGPVLSPTPSNIEAAAASIRSGGLVSFPTETVYGLGANALDPEAVARIYAAKGRPAWNPVIVHVAGVADARVLAQRWPETAERLAAAFWPGPLTLVVPKGAQVPDIVTAGGHTVAVRMPAHPVALALIRAAGVPLAAPSANRFTQVSPTTAQHVIASLGDRVPLVLDGGPCAVGIESTVVDCTGEAVVILRPGMIGRESLEMALEGAGVPVRHSERQALAHDRPEQPAAPAPGMSERHYAPRAEVWLFAPTQADEMRAALHARRAEEAAGRPHGQIVALLKTVTFAGPDAPDRITGMPDDPAAYARALYAALHDADAGGATLVIIEGPPDETAWEAVRDRLTRASR
jgi:L-threonylcarbamoyladenylate synthase